MPVDTASLPLDVQAKVDAFLASPVDMASFYRSYTWRNDTHAKGFPDILGLELQFQFADATKGIGPDEVLAVAEWGRLRNRTRLQTGLATASFALAPNRFRLLDTSTSPDILKSPSAPLLELIPVHGLGYTYQSKTLRFAIPELYGALDSRLVMCFGRGSDPHLEWLALKGAKGAIRQTTQKRWLEQFGCWTTILRYIAGRLPHNCPHPQAFVEHGLRRDGIWTCADVEMALFSYASARLGIAN